MGMESYRRQVTGTKLPEQSQSLSENEPGNKEDIGKYSFVNRIITDEQTTCTGTRDFPL
jgi:hypothetical protein